VAIPVDAGIIQVRHQGRSVATHQQAPPGSPPVWDPSHRAAAEAIALAPHRRHLRLVPDQPAPAGPAGLELGAGDYDVEEIDLGRYDLGCGCSGQGA
jgi:hypothetical protein